MKSRKIRHISSELLKVGMIKINGNNPWDIKVHNEALYGRVMDRGSVGLGEAYMDGWWDCKRLDQFFYRFFRRIGDRQIRSALKENHFMLLRFLLLTKSLGLTSRIINMQSRSRAFQVGERHYDLGNDLFRNTLDKSMAYSCAYWKNARTLDKAQEDKFELICKKIGLKHGQKILDIGCGWGGFVKYAAQKYNARVVGITVSKEQVSFAKKSCKGLPVQIRLQDYREIKEKFDHIVSLGMFEHVGQKNYREYMKVAHRSLNDNGLFLLHTIGTNKSVTTIDPWINKYIFPNALLPSIEQIGKSIEDLFIMEDWHNFSADYDKTIMQWFRNFDRNWHKIKSNYDERFYRMWKYYLLLVAALFRARRTQLWQIVLSKKGVEGGYQSVR